MPSNNTFKRSDSTRSTGSTSGRSRSNSKSSTTMDEDLRRMKEEFKKRVEDSAARKLENDKDEQAKLVVQIAVRAGLLFMAGISLCFSSFFIPGVMPFLGGLLCGVSLVEPPPLPGLPSSSTRTSRPGEDASKSAHSPRAYREHFLTPRSGGDNVIKQVLMNFIDHFF